jgi:hypothetical protein
VARKVPVAAAEGPIYISEPNVGRRMEVNVVWQARLARLGGVWCGQDGRRTGR